MSSCYVATETAGSLYVYDVDYSGLREYNATFGRISGSLNQIAKRMNASGNVYAADVKQVKELMQQIRFTLFDYIIIFTDLQ